MTRPSTDRTRLLGPRSWLVPLLAATLAGCSSGSPTVLSDPPSSTATGGSTTAPSPEATGARTGRFIARCATEADAGAVPGDTTFTDGGQGVTDFCLRRFYAGVQPAPGSVFVPDAMTATPAPAPSLAPSRPSWTAAQPRSDSTAQALTPTSPGATGTYAPGTNGPTVTAAPSRTAPTTDVQVPPGGTVPSSGATAPTTTVPTGTAPTGTSNPAVPTPPVLPVLPGAEPTTPRAVDGEAPPVVVPVQPPAPASGSGSGQGSNVGSPSVVVPR